jgi:hypothetical protein
MTDTVKLGQPQASFTSYSIDMEVEDFLAVTKAEHISRDQLIPDTETISARLEGIHLKIDPEVQGIDCVEYNGHFGAAIHYRVDTDEDTPQLHAAVAHIITDQVMRARAAIATAGEPSQQ